ncbi:MAG TPA: hypothetical protein VGL06_28845 [Pseudonocardiaceae bacterium]
MRTAGLLFALAIGATVVLPNTAAAAVAASCTWHSSTLSGPAGTSATNLYTTDDNGGWAGTAYFSGVGYHVVTWKNGTVTDYGGVGAPSASTIVDDENRSGALAVTMMAGPYTYVQNAYRITGGQWQQLAPAAGGSHPEARAINDAGDVFGTDGEVSNGLTGTVVLRWPANQTTPVAVAGLPFDSTVLGLDDDGTLLVGIPDANGVPVPHLLRGGVLYPLPPSAGNVSSYAVAISNGRVTGSVVSKSVKYTAVVWDGNQVAHALPGGDMGVLINPSDLVVGTLGGSGATNGVWRNGTLEYTFGTTNNYIALGAISDDGSFAGDVDKVPTVWQCS